jgi:hypothetical protein
VIENHCNCITFHIQVIPLCRVAVTDPAYRVIQCTDAQAYAKYNDSIGLFGNTCLTISLLITPSQCRLHCNNYFLRDYA